MRKLAMIVIGMSLTLAAPAPADAIRKWRTPDGKLYFGDRPPAGSKLLGMIESTERVETVDVPPPDPVPRKPGAAEAGAEISRRRAAEREAERERAHRLASAVEFGPHTVTLGNLNWIVVGVVRNRADESVHDVRVGAGTAWTRTEPSTIPGKSEATFRLEVPRYAYGDTDAFPGLEVDWREKR